MPDGKRTEWLQRKDLLLLSACADTRLLPVLIRCGGGRLVCPAQDALHWVEIIERDGTDYVRDISKAVTA